MINDAASLFLSGSRAVAAGRVRLVPPSILLVEKNRRPTAKSAVGRGSGPTMDGRHAWLTRPSDVAASARGVVVTQDHAR